MDIVLGMRRMDMTSAIQLNESILVDTGSRRIYLSKPVLTAEDEIASSFASVLEELGIRYSIVAGYIAIMFGRSRRSDDIDFIAYGVGEEKFIELCRRLGGAGFELMQGDISSEESLRRIYREYLGQGYSVRFMYRGTILPNIEFKLARTRYQIYSIENCYEVVLNNSFRLRIAPIELQIAYKLRLGSEKDMGDAAFLYSLFKQVINGEELKMWCEELGVNIKLLV